ncbi:MAG: CPBP family intramembrane metalloprotease [Clostridiaceae bacterium]|jgi:membrane protease YdiL (CAAX protease family)|nr:CPBP family intramembrane metalloprotease [Clostridiaceae bacterium]
MENEKIILPKKLPMPFDSGLLYTVVALYYVYVSKYIARMNIALEFRLILSQVLFLVVPPVFLAFIRGYDIKKTFRLKAPRPLEAVIMLVMSPVMVVAGFCAGFVALLAIKGVFGKVYLEGDITDLMTRSLPIALLLIAVLPAVCEELLFRGMIQKGLERLGAGWSILLSGILFGLFHFDFQRLAAQTIIGLLSAYVVYRTGSIFNGMILHFMNNGLLTLFSNFTAGSQVEGAKVITDPFATPEFLQLAEQYGMSLEQLLGLMAGILSVLFVISAGVLIGLLFVVKAITKGKVEKPEKVKGSAKGLLIGFPGILLIGIIYTALALTLLNNELGKNILQFMGMI